MIDFLNRIFGRQTSGATAKERLRLVLMSDHLSLAPEMIESMKADLVDVISRYVEVDRDKIDVHFEHQDKALAMLANIPITGVNRNGNGTHTESTAPRTESPQAQVASASLQTIEPATCHADAAVTHTEGATSHADAAICHAEPVEAQPSAVEAYTSRSARRKRRKHLHNSGGQSPQTGSPAPAT